LGSPSRRRARPPDSTTAAQGPRASVMLVIQPRRGPTLSQ
jgi:hypothetical protein